MVTVCSFLLLSFPLVVHETTNLLWQLYLIMPTVSQCSTSSPFLSFLFFFLLSSCEHHSLVECPDLRFLWSLTLCYQVSGDFDSEYQPYLSESISSNLPYFMYSHLHPFTLTDQLVFQHLVRIMKFHMGAAPKALLHGLKDRLAILISFRSSCSL